MIFSDGTWSDLTTLSDGRVVLGYSTPRGNLRFLQADGLKPLGERQLNQWLRYLRVSGSASGHLLAVGQDHATGKALFSVDLGQTSSLGACTGPSPVECIPYESGWKVYVIKPGRCETYFINEFGTYEYLDEFPTRTTSGILQCDDGIVQLSDHFRYSIPGLINPVTSGDYAIGTTPEVLGLYHQGRHATVFTGNAQDPRILVTESKLYGTAMTPYGTWFDTVIL